ncbi:MAG: protein-glutamate O-methyltransferase [Kordiimonadaceae bacterium]|nr:protein-glutamate O-methyltransferase [Kordiimonadaceae bacterium]
MKARTLKFRQSEFKALQELVYKRTGIKLKDGKKEMVYMRISRRIRALGLEGFKDYLTYLTSKEGVVETVDFVNAITTNLTRFFRESHHFTHLRKEVLNGKVEGNRRGLLKKKIRIWSAACSSGMEPYSIAMTVLASIPKGCGWDVQILATDIDTNMLEKGKLGVYSEGDMKDVPKPLLRRFVNFENGNAIMSDEIKAIVHFKHLNLIEAWPIKSYFDAVFCRNVMIYFDNETQIRLVSRFVDQIDDQGMLYVGHAEALTATNPNLVNVGRSCFQVNSQSGTKP